MSHESSPTSTGAPRHGTGADGAAGVDAQLVRESRFGSPRARRALIDRHQHAVYNLALRMLGAPDAAATVAEETFVKAFRRLSALPSDQRLAPWLLRIAHNTALDALRRPERRDAAAEPVARPPSPASSAGEGGTGSAAEAVAGGGDPASAGRGEPFAMAFEQLPMRYRAAIVLRYQARLSFAEVGDVMGVPERTARTRVEGARRALAERLRTAPQG